MVLALTLLFGASTQSGAAINHCVGADGGAVYTDRRCAAIGSLERLPDPGLVPIRATRELGFGCAARSPEAMRQAVYSALTKSDANALAGLYNFAGRSSHSASVVMRRMQRLTRRRAVEIELIHPPSESVLGWAMPPPDELPRLRIRQYPVGAEAHGILLTESFSLRRAAGCLWLGS